MENYTDKFTQRVNDLVEQSKEPIKTVECIYNGMDITDDKQLFKDWYRKQLLKDIKQPIKQQKRVECIENHYQDINIGDEFFVVKEDETWYWIKAHLFLEEMRVRKFRFKVLEPKAVLKRVKFRYAKEISTHSDVTCGNTYDVVKITSHYYTIVDDKGKEQSYNKDYFRKNKKAKKKEKKIKLLRNHLAISKSLIDFFKDESISSFAFSTYYNLNKIAYEEINKDNPNMNRIKFLMDSINKINKTNN
jgi:hypothetical protein